MIRAGNKQSTRYAPITVPVPQGLEKHAFRQQLTYTVDLDERGVFKAHVANDYGTVLFEINSEDDDEGQIWLVEDGFMRHARDVDGLHDYLISMGIAKAVSTLRIEG
jgi:hypothetical protein